MSDNEQENRYKYPAPYELEQALDLCPREFVEGFALTRGIIVTNGAQHDLADCLSDLLFDDGDLQEIREAALQATERSSLAGFVVHSEDQAFDLVALLDDARNSTVDERRSMRLGPVVSRQVGSGTVHQGTVGYVEYRPGRIEFLQGLDRSFGYSVHQTEECCWQVLIDCNRSNDAKIMEEWLKKALPRAATVLDTVDQDKLTSPQTVQFFDRLSQEGTGPEWTFTQVRRLALRRAGGKGKEDDEEIEADTAQLSVITHAILEGESLRNDPFVKQCEKGYRFTAMTCEYEHREHALLMEVRAEFKGRPKVFEVALERYRGRAGLDQELRDTHVSSEERRRLLASYWRQGKRIYDELSNA